MGSGWCSEGKGLFMRLLSDYKVAGGGFPEIQEGVFDVEAGVFVDVVGMHFFKEFCGP